MLDQLYFTSAGIGLSGFSGYGPRAASHGLRDIHNTHYSQVLEPLLNFYDLPKNTSPSIISAQDAPVSLAYLEVGGEHLLLHKKYVGVDEVGRPGNNFLAHVITGLPREYSARDAIQLWDSPFWPDKVERTASTLLPQIAIEQLTQGTLGPLQLRTPFAQRAISFVIHAFLALDDEEKRMYILAPAEVVAALIWGLTQAFPLSLQMRVTFSTYEGDVSKGRGLITGTDWPEAASRVGQDNDLPDWCYRGKGLGINVYSDRKTPLSMESREWRFADYASRQLVAGDWSELKGLLKTAEELGVTNAKQFLLIFHLFTAGQQEGGLTPADVSYLLNNLDLAQRILQRSGVQTAIFRRPTEESVWWQREGRASIRSLRSQADSRSLSQLDTGLRSLAQAAVDRGVQFMLKGDLAYGGMLIKELAPTAAPGLSGQLWTSAFEQLTTAISPGGDARLGWETKSWLLLNWADNLPALSLARIKPWLLVNWSELPHLLTLALPEAWKIDAIRLKLADDPRNDTIPANIVIIFNDHRPLFGQALAIALQQPDKTSILHLFSRLVEAPLSDRVVVLNWLVQQTRDAHFVESLLATIELRWDAEDLPYLAEFGNLTAQLLMREKAQARMIELLGRQNWWKGQGKAFILRLRSSVAPSAWPVLQAGLNGIIRKAQDFALDAIQAESLSDAKYWMDEVIPTLGEEEGTRQAWAVCLDMLHRRELQGTRRQWSIAVRTWLLTSWQRMLPANVDTSRLRSWLGDSWEELDQVLRLDLPPNWHKEAILLRLVSMEPLPANFSSVLKKRPGPYRAALEDLAHQYNKQPLLQLLEIEAKQRDADKLELVLLLLEEAANDRRFLSLVIEKAVLQRSELESLLAQHATLLLGALGDDPVLIKVIENYIARLDANNLFERQVSVALEHLDNLGPSALPANLKRRTHAWNVLCDLVLRRQISNFTLADLVRALEVVSPEQQQQLIPLLVPTLPHLLDNGTQIAYLRERIDAELPKRVLHMIVSASSFIAYPRQLAPFVECWLDGRLTDGEGRELWSALAAGGPRLLDQLEEFTATWPPGLYERWQDWRASLIPPTQEHTGLGSNLPEEPVESQQTERDERPATTRKQQSSVSGRNLHYNREDLSPQGESKRQRQLPFGWGTSNRPSLIDTIKGIIDDILMFILIILILLASTLLVLKFRDSEQSSGGPAGIPITPEAAITPPLPEGAIDVSPIK